MENNETHPTKIEEPLIDDLTICTNLLRSLVNIRLDYEQTRYMWQVMKVLRRKPLDADSPKKGRKNK